MGQAVPEPTKRSWVKANLAIVLVIIAIVAAVAAGSTYYVLFVAPCKAPGGLRFYESLAPSEAKFFQDELIPEFQSIYPNITVTLVNLPGASDESNDVRAIVKGNCVGTTLVGIDNLVVGELIYGNDVMNLTSILGSIEPPTLISSAQKMIAYEQQVFGATYFVPFRSNIPLVFYSKTAFNDAQITSVPLTTSELMSAADKLVSAGHSHPIMFQGGERDASAATELYQWMVQYGGNPFLFNDTGGLQAFQDLQGMSKYFNPDYINGYWGTFAGLASGDYQILDYQWPYVYNQLTNATLKMTDSTLGVYPGPSGPQNSNHVLGGDVLVVPKGATNLAAIEAFAKFLLDSKAQTETLVKLSWVAVNSEAYKSLPPNVSTIGQSLLDAIQQGVFLRNPAPWISHWNALVYDAWKKIVVANPRPAPSEIKSILDTENQQLYTYLVSNYGVDTAQQYKQNVFKPISVS